MNREITEIWREPSRGGYPDPKTFTLSGLDMVRAGIEPDVRPPIVRLTGAGISEVSEDRVVCTMPASDWFLSSQEHISVGALLMIADAAFGCAVMLGLPPLTPFSTSELSMTFLKPCRPGGTLRATGTPVSHGQPLSIAQAWVEDGHGERVAFGTSTCFVQPSMTELPTSEESPEGPEPEYDTPDPFLRPACGAPISWETWRSMSGADLLAGQIAGDLEQPPIHYLTGMTLREFSAGRAVFTLPATRWLTTALRTVQGGAIGMLGHAALASAVTSTLEAGAAYRPIDVKVNYLRPVYGDGRDLVATGVVTHRGKTLAVAAADVVAGNGKKVAIATGSTMIVPSRP